MDGAATGGVRKVSWTVPELRRRRLLGVIRRSGRGVPLQPRAADRAGKRVRTERDVLLSRVLP